MWDAHVDFDLAAFHCHVRMLKRTLRELTEASLCNVLLQDFSHVTALPGNLMNPSDNCKADAPQALLPASSERSNGEPRNESIEPWRPYNQ